MQRDCLQCIHVLMPAERLPAVHSFSHAYREVLSLQCICVLMPAQRSPAVHLFSAVREIACSTVIWSCLALSGPVSPTLVWPCLALSGPVWPDLALSSPFLAMPFPIRACLALLVRPSGHAKTNGNAYTHVQISCMNSGVGSLTHLLAPWLLGYYSIQIDVPHTLSCPAKCSDTYPNRACHGYCRSSGRGYGS
jgi:hypothetical protein